jgi:hypothetical protein
MSRRWKKWTKRCARSASAAPSRTVIAFPLEYCDDCGAPMFPNAAGHVVHTEPPEEAEDRPATPLH